MGTRMPAQMLATASRFTLPDTKEEWQATAQRECSLPASCQPASAWGSGETRWPAVIRSLSVAGACLHLERRFERGTGLAIELPKCADRDAYTVLARVIHLDAATGGWSLGCKFISELDEDELERLLKQGAQQPAPSRAPAFELDMPLRRQKTASAIKKLRCQIEIRPGTIVDYTVRKPIVSGTWPPTPGKAVWLRGQSGARKWSLTVIVVKCREDGDSWLLRGHLKEPPSADRLLSLIGSSV